MALIDHVNAYLLAKKRATRTQLLADAALQEASVAPLAGEAEPASGDEDYQRKFLGQATPWLALYDSAAGEEDADGGAQGATSLSGPQLVIVASLIDKLPNQGGITRTSEACGASGVVLADRKALRKPAFFSVAVTAHEHVPLEFVPPERLVAYLARKRAEGWAVVGLEQTTNSVRSWDYEWPARKSLLVLGHEQRGMPAEVIAACDVCLEIPLYGRIRSLNVHVSASMVIADWSRRWHTDA